jgi:hypothetical protein
LLPPLLWLPAVRLKLQHLHQHLLKPQLPLLLLLLLPLLPRQLLLQLLLPTLLLLLPLLPTLLHQLPLLPLPSKFLLSHEKSRLRAAFFVASRRA